MRDNSDRSRSIVGELDRQAERQPTRQFVRVGDGIRTYGELREASQELAAGLRAAGVQPGDRVAVLSANRIESIECFFGLAEAGAINVPLNVYLKGEFLRYQLRDSSATTLIVDGPALEAVRPILDDLPDLQRLVLLDGMDDATTDLPSTTLDFGDLRQLGRGAPNLGSTRPDPTDVSAIMYTSGTTGMPKGCVLDNGYFVHIGHANAGFFAVVDDDYLFTMLPLFHMGAYCTAILPALVRGASSETVPSFSASGFMRSARDAGATVVMGVGPAAIAILMSPPEDAEKEHRLRLASFAPMPAAMQLAFEERFELPVLAEGYGQTECVPISVSSPSAAIRDRDSVGQPVPWLDVRIVDEMEHELPAGSVGEIVLRPHHAHAMFRGYWGKAEDTLQTWRNLWHHTGDFGRLDDHGLLHFVDRKQDSIRRRGENVSSLELELALLRHPAISEAAAHAVPAELGEDDIKVCLVIGECLEELDFGELFGFFKRELPYYAVPRYVEVLDRLPRNELGKVKKQELRARGTTSGTVDLQALGFTISAHERRQA